MVYIGLPIFQMVIFYSYVKLPELWKDSPFLMGKLTISMAMFYVAFCMFTRPGSFVGYGKNHRAVGVHGFMVP